MVPPCTRRPFAIHEWPCFTELSDGFLPVDLKVVHMSTEHRNRVLIVEDTLIMAEVLKRSLSRAGLDPTVARNGVEACELVAKQEFDAVVTDFQMPRMNGDEFVRNLRLTALNCDVPVIFVSAKGLEIDTEQMRMELGIRDFLSKPFSPSELVKVIYRRLNRDENGVCLAEQSSVTIAEPAM